MTLTSLIVSGGSPLVLLAICCARATEIRGSEATADWISSLRFIAFPSMEVLPQNDKAFSLPGESGGLGLADGKRKEPGASRDDHVLLAVEPVGDGCGVDGRPQLYVPQILSCAPIEGNEVAVRVAGKDEPTRGGERSPVGAAEVFELPLLRSRRGVERFERSGRSHHGVRHVDASQKVVAHAIRLRRGSEDVAFVGSRHIDELGLWTV